jgi:hypothetical protein
MGFLGGRLAPIGRQGFADPEDLGPDPLELGERQPRKNVHVGSVVAVVRSKHPVSAHEQFEALTPAICRRQCKPRVVGTLGTYCDRLRKEKEALRTAKQAGRIDGIGEAARRASFPDRETKHVVRIDTCGIAR